MIDRPVLSVEVSGLMIRRVSPFFSEAPEGEAVALINSFGYLEIAVNRGDAAKSLGVSLGQEVTVRFRSA
jgi:S-adenosylmethionine hydrolase